MQNNVKFLAIMLGIVATMGLATINNVHATESGIAGHIELVKRDSEGNITQYVQTDNFVTDEGRDCIVEALFATNTGTCGTPGTFTTVAIGTSTAAQTASSTTLGGVLTGGCVSGTDGTVAVNAGTATQRATVTVIFGGAGSTGADVISAACEVDVEEAGLFNGAPGTGDMFAWQSTGGTITIGNADTLTVTWDIDFT